jgi:hypothetical protein
MIVRQLAAERLVGQDLANLGREEVLLLPPNIYKRKVRKPQTNVVL